MKRSTSTPRSKLSLRILLCAIAVLLHAQTIALSQTSSTGTVYGRVLDSNAAVVIGADVELRNSAIGRSQKQQSNNFGQFLFSRVLPGEYDLVIRRRGFRQVIISGLKVEVTKSYGSDVILEVGDVTETVNIVAAESADLQKTDATIGTVLPGKSLIYLPSLERNTAEFLTLQPGTTPEAGDSDNGSRGGSVTGARTDQSTFTLDGIDITENSTGGGAGFRTMIPISVESVEEFRVAVTNPGASFGRSAGGQVALIGRRGSNEFHFAGYWYHQNDNLNANSWTNNRSAIPRPELKDNRYGFRLGGPFRHDKEFFFVNYEGRDFSRPFDVLRVVPSETLRRGILRFRDNAGRVVSYDLATSTLCGLTNTGRCDPRRIGISPSVAALWSLMPQGNDFASGDGLNTIGWRSTVDAPLENDFVVVRYDRGLTENWWLNFSGTYARRLSTLGGPNGLRQQLDIREGRAVFTGEAPLRGQNFTLGLTGSFTPATTSSLKLGWTRDRQSTTPINPSSVAKMLAIPGTNHNGGSVALNIGGGNLDQLLSEPIDVDSQRGRFQSNDNESFQLVYDATWIKSNHSTQFGFNARHIITRHMRNDKILGSLASLVADISRGTNILIPPSSRPPLCSTPGQGNCLRTSDVAQWDALFAGVTGLIDNVSILAVRDSDLHPLPFGTSIDADTKHNAYEFYFQDSWQIKPSFTMTVGISYGWQRPPVDKFDRQTQMINIETGKALTYENYIEPRRQAALQGDIYNPLIGFERSSSAGGPRTDWTNFAPRVAAAWNPSFNEPGVLNKLFGDRSTVLRGGFGILYDRINTSESVILPSLGAGFSQTISVRAPACNLTGAGGPNCVGNASSPLSNFRVGVDGTIPVPVQPTLSFPYTPSQPFGEAVSFQIDPNFEVGENYSFDLTLQRRLPRGLIVELGWIARLGRKLPASVNFNSSPFFHVDSLSGQTFAQAFDAVAELLRQGVPVANIPAQPWFQNNTPGGTARVIAGNEANFINGNVSNVFQVIDLARLREGLKTFNNVQTQTAFVRTSLGRSNYHAFVLTGRQPLSRGLTLDLNYTFSKSLDQSSAPQNATNTLQSAFDLNFDYGPSDFDRTHTVNGQLLYEIPLGRDHRLHATGKLDKLLSGWSVGAVFRAASGLPLIVSQGVSALGGGVVLTTPSGAVSTVNTSHISTGVNHGISGSNNIGTNGNPASGGSGINLFTDPGSVFANFRRVLLSHDGRSGRANPLRGFRTWNLDLSLGKTTHVNDKVQARLSLDFFNALNHPIFSNPTLELTNPAGFGVVTQQNVPTRRESSSRWIQGGLRIEF